MPEQSVPMVSILWFVVLKSKAEIDDVSLEDVVLGIDVLRSFADLGPSPCLLLGFALGKNCSRNVFAVKQRVGFFGFGDACLQPHLEHTGVLVYVGNNGASGSSIEKNVCVLMFLSDTNSQNRKSECCSSGLGLVFKNCRYASRRAFVAANRRCSSGMLGMPTPFTTLIKLDGSV